MRCGECGAEMHFANVRLDEQFGSVRFEIEGIPARVCDQCGTKEVSLPLLEAFEALAEQLEREVARRQHVEGPLAVAGEVRST